MLPYDAHDSEKVMESPVLSLWLGKPHMSSQDKQVSFVKRAKSNWRADKVLIQFNIDSCFFEDATFLQLLSNCFDMLDQRLQQGWNIQQQTSPFSDLFCADNNNNAVVIVFGKAALPDNLSFHVVPYRYWHSTQPPLAHMNSYSTWSVASLQALRDLLQQETLQQTADVPEPISVKAAADLLRNVHSL